MNNTEMPIGFTMELAMHPDKLNRFSQMTDGEKQAIIDQARNVQSREEMQLLVASIK